MNADGRSDESQLTQALSTSVTDHPSAMLASGQYSLDQSVNKSPSRHSRRQKIEREGWTDNKERGTVLQTEAKEKKKRNYRFNTRKDESWRLYLFKRDLFFYYFIVTFVNE